MQRFLHFAFLSTQTASLPLLPLNRIAWTAVGLSGIGPAMLALIS